MPFLNCIKCQKSATRWLPFNKSVVLQILASQQGSSLHLVLGVQSRAVLLKVQVGHLAPSFVTQTSILSLHIMSQQCCVL